MTWGLQSFWAPTQTDKKLKYGNVLKTVYRSTCLFFVRLRWFFFSNLLDFNAESKYELFLAIPALPDVNKISRHLVATESRQRTTEFGFRRWILREVGLIYGKFLPQRALLSTFSPLFGGVSGSVKTVGKLANHYHSGLTIHRSGSNLLWEVIPGKLDPKYHPLKSKQFYHKSKNSTV